MKIDLGCVKVPFEGPFNFALAFGGIFFGLAMVTLVFNVVDVKGPAVIALETSPLKPYVNVQDLIDNCGKTMVATSIWCLMYYNYLGIAVQTVFLIHVFEMFTKDDVTDKFGPNAGRFAGNMMEQSPVFLTAMWTYTLLVDYETGGALGLLYIFGRALYPFFYMACHQFTFWFEFNTQIGYGVNGVFMLGILVNGMGGDWAEWANDNQILAAIVGFLLGSCGPFPGIPLTPLYTFIHYKCDRRFKAKEDSKVVNA